MKQDYKKSKNYNEIMYINFIQKILKEYPTYEKKIESRVNEILEELKLNPKIYLKQQEDINKHIEKDKELNVLKARKKLLDNVLPELKKNNPKAYIFVKKRYFEGKHLKDVMEQMKLVTPTETFDLEFVAIKYIGNKLRNSKDFLRKV